ncbi:hypothetical protein U1Q18_014205 [Sarracenia purpurea var. burkii]
MKRRTCSVWASIISFFFSLLCFAFLKERGSRGFLGSSSLGHPMSGELTLQAAYGTTMVTGLPRSSGKVRICWGCHLPRSRRKIRRGHGAFDCLRDPWAGDRARDCVNQTWILDFAGPRSPPSNYMVSFVKFKHWFAAFRILASSRDLPPNWASVDATARACPGWSRRQRRGHTTVLRWRTRWGSDLGALLFSPPICASYLSPYRTCSPAVLVHASIEENFSPRRDDSIEV